MHGAGAGIRGGSSLASCSASKRGAASASIATGVAESMSTRHGVSSVCTVEAARGVRLCCAHRRGDEARLAHGCCQ